MIENHIVLNWKSSVCWMIFNNIILINIMFFSSKLRYIVSLPLYWVLLHIQWYIDKKLKVRPEFTMKIGVQSVVSSFFTKSDWPISFGRIEHFVVAYVMFMFLLTTVTKKYWIRPNWIWLDLWETREAHYTINWTKTCTFFSCSTYI